MEEHFSHIAEPTSTSESSSSTICDGGSRDNNLNNISQSETITCANSGYFHQNNLHMIVISTVTLTLDRVFVAVIKYCPVSLLDRFSGSLTSSPSLYQTVSGLG